MRSRTRRTLPGALATLALAALLTACHGNGGTAAPAPTATTGTPSASAPSAAPSAPASAPAAGGTPVSAPGSAGAAAGGGCRSLVATAAVKQAVTTDYGRQAQPALTHIQPRKGDFFYGVCNGVYYAATPFGPTPGATYAEQVALQDDGGTMKYLRQGADGQWRYIAGAGFPSDPHGCAAIPQIPAALAAAWGDCQLAH